MSLVNRGIKILSERSLESLNDKLLGESLFVDGLKFRVENLDYENKESEDFSRNDLINEAVRGKYVLIRTRIDEVMFVNERIGELYLSYSRFSMRKQKRSIYLAGV